MPRNVILAIVCLLALAAPVAISGNVHGETAIDEAGAHPL